MSDDRAHTERLIKEYKRRLRPLEIRKARLGSTSDPALDLEIEDLHAQIAGLELTTAPRPTQAVKDAIRNRFDDEFDFLIAQFTEITRRQTRTEDRLGAVEDGQARLRIERAADRETDEKGRVEARAELLTLLHRGFRRVWGAIGALVLVLILLSYVRGMGAAMSPDDLKWVLVFGGVLLILILLIGVDVYWHRK